MFARKRKTVCQKSAHRLQATACTSSGKAACSTRPQPQAPAVEQTPARKRRGRPGPAPRGSPPAFSPAVPVETPPFLTPHVHHTPFSRDCHATTPRHITLEHSGAQAGAALAPRRRPPCLASPPLGSVPLPGTLQELPCRGRMSAEMPNASPSRGGEQGQRFLLRPAPGALPGRALARQSLARWWWFTLPFDIAAHTRIWRSWLRWLLTSGLLLRLTIPRPSTFRKGHGEK